MSAKETSVQTLTVALGKVSIARESATATFERRLAMFATPGHEYTAEEVDDLARERAEFAFIISFQSEIKRGGWAYDLRFAAGTCKALWLEEAVWKSVSRMRRGPLERTHLMYAAYQGDAARVKWLIARGAQVDETDAVTDADDGGSHTALHWTVMCPQWTEGHADVVRALIDEGADVNAKTRGNGMRPFRQHIEGEGRAAYTPLLFAVEKGHAEAVRLLLSLGCEKDAGPDGWSPAHHAARMDQVDMLQVLRDSGADLNGLSNEGWGNNGGQPLHVAAKSGSLEAMKYLINVVRVDVNSLSSSGRTPLHYAAAPHYCSGEREQSQCDNSAAMKMLLDHGANINAQTPRSQAAPRGEVSGKTPLHLAVYWNCFNSVVFLVATGASCQLKDSSGRTALHTSRALRARIDSLLEGIPRAA